MRLGGVTAWSIENDDYTGDFCGQGPYPLLTTLSKQLLEKKISLSITSKKIIKTTTKLPEPITNAPKLDL